SRGRPRRSSKAVAAPVSAALLRQSSVTAVPPSLGRGGQLLRGRKQREFVTEAGLYVGLELVEVRGIRPDVDAAVGMEFPQYEPAVSAERFALEVHQHLVHRVAVIADRRGVGNDRRVDV